MMNWTKAALVKRLEDEDNREKEILGLKEQLAQSQKKTGSLRNAAKDVPIHMLKDAQRQLVGEKKICSHIKNEIDDLVQRKRKLGEALNESILKIEKLEALVKSLI